MRIKPVHVHVQKRTFAVYNCAASLPPSGPSELHRQDDGAGGEPARAQPEIHTWTNAQVRLCSVTCTRPRLHDACMHPHLLLLAVLTCTAGFHAPTAAQEVLHPLEELSLIR